MKQFIRKSAALALIFTLLATGCSSKTTSLGDPYEISESVDSEESSDSSSTSETDSTDGSSLSSDSGTSSDSGSSTVNSDETSDTSSNIDGSGNGGSGNTGNGNTGNGTTGNGNTGNGNTGNGNTGNGSTGNGNTGNGNTGNGSTGNGNTGNGSTGNGNTGNGNTGNGSTGNGSTGNGNTGNGNGGSQSSNTPSGGSVSSEFDVSWKPGGTWQEGGKTCGTVELTIVNNTGKDLSSWKISFDVPNGFSISNGWSAQYSVNGTKLTASNESYNGNIPAGGSIGIGFNYSSPTEFAPPASVSINGTAGSSSGNNNNNQNQNQNNNNNQNNNQNNNSNQNGSDKNQNDPVPSEDVQKLLERSDKAVQGDDWLHTDGNRILDKNGKQVWLTGVNWFGYNTGTNTFDGLWNSQMRGTVKAIADHGFNLIRVPISAELLNQWSRGEYPKANYNNASNPELNDMNSLQIFDYFLKLAEENGMKVMPDIHCAETNAMGHNVNLWYTDKVSVEDYYHALEWLADRYKNNDTIIAIDIKNEPHGKPNEGSGAAIWNNSKDKNNWKYTAEQAAARILAKNPNVLIMVEGTEIYSKNNGSYSSQNSADYYFNWWGGNLRGVRDYPVDLGKYQDKLVYSPHDYGPTVYEQPWFEGGFDYNSLIRDCWQDNWLYIQKENIAPLLIGEWGGFMKEPNLKWMTCMRKLIKEYHLNHTFWCYNANSGDTGGLVLDDFTTWDSEKYNFVKEVLWQEDGKFVGLDHAIPLGANGITLSSAKGLS